MSKQTSINIQKATSERLKKHGEKFKKSASGMAELAIEWGLEFVEENGYDSILEKNKKS